MDERSYARLMEPLLRIAAAKIAWQLETYNALETKAVGLLALDGALGMGASVIHHITEPYWGGLLASLFLSAVGSLASLSVRRVYTGPDLRDIYRLSHSLKIPESALASLLASLSQAYEENSWPIARKGLFWTFGAIFLSLGLVMAAVSLIRHG